MTSLGERVNGYSPVTIRPDNRRVYLLGAGLALIIGLVSAAIALIVYHLLTARVKPFDSAAVNWAGVRR